MATVRVFLFTYRRNNLLLRALASLQAQTFADWVCELHNDDPTDPYPAQLAQEVSDSRITCITHDQNLGPVRSYNLAFSASISERYVSMLHDDNWWEPEFLNAMVRDMDARPGIEVGWANMRLWQEEPDTSWSDTGRTIWDGHKGTEPALFYWPDSRQLYHTLHSDGAMLIRTGQIDRLVLSPNTPFVIAEAVRDRLFRPPIMFVPAALANFAMTRQTSRARSATKYGQSKALQAASFVRHVKPGADDGRGIWAEARAARPPRTSSLINAGLIDRKSRYFLRHSRPIDWLRYFKSAVRRPISWLRTLRAKRELPGLWAVLDDGARLQQLAAAERGANHV